MGILMLAVVFVGGEVFALVIFKMLNKKFLPNLSKDNIGIHPILKGIIERFFITLGLFLDFPQVIIAFGAFKIGTRLRAQEENRISNDYYFVGNIISLTISLLVFFVWKEFFR